jgi:hypothetical protein
MSELSREARGLIDDGHSVLRPSSGDRARVKSALAARLGGAALLLPHQANAATTASKWLIGWSKAHTLIAGMGAGVLVIGATYLAAQSSVEPAASPPVKPPAVAPLAARSPAAPLNNVAPIEAQPSAPEPAVSSLHKQAPVDPLVEEVAILSRATSALRAGKPAEGLRLLNEHQRKFPNGRLAEERRAARIQALCAMGKRTEAEAELARLAQSSPRSPHLARAQRACGFTP